jgi:hypothetical protein
MVRQRAVEAVSFDSIHSSNKVIRLLRHGQPQATRDHVRRSEGFDDQE